MRAGNLLQLIPRLRQRHVDDALALLDPIQQKLQRQGRLAGSGVALDQVEVALAAARRSRMSSRPEMPVGIRLGCAWSRCTNGFAILCALVYFHLIAIRNTRLISTFKIPNHLLGLHLCHVPGMPTTMHFRHVV